MPVVLKPFRQRLELLLACLVLAGATLSIYWPVHRFEFIHFDDPEYVLHNPHVASGLTAGNVTWAFTANYAGNWHPVTWLSHMLDVQLFGMNPGAHHLVNVGFHTANALLLLFLLRALTGLTWPSAAVAGLFALHPLHVESVAWVAERKDVLSAFFFFLLLLCYSRYARLCAGKAGKPAAAWCWYSLALVFCALGLMSKPMLVTTPFVLLLLDWWPLGRVPAWLKTADSLRGTATSGVAEESSVARPASSLRLLLEKAPFFVLVIASSILTFIAQRKEGAVAEVSGIPLGFRIENAFLSYVRYLGKMVWPARLASYYPLPHEIPIEGVLVAAGLLLILTIAILLQWKKRPWLAFGWFWYLGMLVPVIGLVQVGAQSMADRYTYLPLVGIFVALVWAAKEGLARVKSPTLRRCAGWGVGVAVLAACACVASSQVSLWQNSEKLLSYTLALNSENPLPHLNLGNYLAEHNRMLEATAHYQEAVRIWPDYPPARSNMGFALAAQGRYDEAIDYYRSALALKPGMAKTHYLLGSALAAEGKRVEAIAEYKTALSLEPDHLLALNDLAWLLAASPQPALRDGAEAVRLGERACQLSHQEDAQIVGTLADAYAEAGRFDDAIKTAEKAISLAKASNQPQLATRNEELLALYRKHQAFHESESITPKQ